MSFYKFKIQGRMQALNDYIKDNRGAKGKFMGNKMKQAQTDDVAEQIQKFADQFYDGRVPYVSGLVRVEFHWIEINRKRDPDNFIFAKKFILDGMVKAGMLPNDGWNNIAGFVDTWECMPETNGGCIVTVTDEING